MVKTQVDVLPFTVPVTLLGQDVRLTVKPRLNLIIKVDLWELFLDRLKKRFTNWLSDLLQSLLSNLGRSLFGSLAGKVLAGLLGGVLAHLFLKSAPSTPVTAPPDDINGRDRAKTFAGSATTASQLMQTWANTHRHAYAKAYADTLVQLTREGWKTFMPNLRLRSINGYRALPATNAPDREWVVWASTRKALETISIDLTTDNFTRRFRWYELMLMFAVAAYVLRKMTKAEFDEARATALQHASVAGMAAAMQYVNRRIADDTFDFIDENGQAQHANGIKRWDTIGAIIRQEKLNDADMSKRLERLGLEQLPSLPKVI